MPKKKIVEAESMEAIERPEEEETIALVGFPPEANTVGENSVGLRDQDGSEAESDAPEKEIPLQLTSPEEEVPEFVLENDPSTEIPTELAVETGQRETAPEEPKSSDLPAAGTEEPRSESAMENQAQNASNAETDFTDTLPGKMAHPADPGNASKAVQTEEAPQDEPSGDERQAFYGLDFNELDRGLSPEQRQEWNSIYASYRGRNAMSGTIIGVDQHRLKVRDRKTGKMTSQQLYCAIVIPFRVRILIPETEMWVRGEERPGFVLRNMPGAKIDFVIIHVDREAGFAVGSRRLAMPSRRYYFATQPSMNAPGSRVNCDVLVVGPRRCLVSCYGYDIDLTQRELSYTAIPDLREVYHSGQTLGCVVKDYDQEAHRLTVSVKETVPNPYDGAAFRHPVQSHRQGVIAGKYGGGVFCVLSDGVTVMCNYSFHYDDSAFRSGDRVMLIIQRYDDNRKQIYGKIVAKC